MRRPNPQVRPEDALAAWDGVPSAASLRVIVLHFKDPALLRRLFRDLEGLARDACGVEVADWLRIARSPAFDMA